MSFSSLNLIPEINQALKKCAYQKPTPVQLQAIPEILTGQDVIVSAQTGTGKTAAFILPALQYLHHQAKKNAPTVLILTPTRELAEQILKAAQTYGAFIKFSLASLVGGIHYSQQLKKLQKGCNLIVATPGRLLDYIRKRQVDLSQIKMLILDEADRMLDMGFIDDIKEITKKTSTTRQTLLFSATINAHISSVFQKLVKNPKFISLSKEKVATQQIKQKLYKVSNLQHKNSLLKQCINDSNIYKAIIFSATKINADNLANQLCKQGYKASVLHSGIKQTKRYRTIDSLKRGQIQFLVATDVASRGIDINDISHVINFDLPKFCEDYVHRIGRTGRAGKSGIAISFVLPTEKKHLQRIERYIGQRLEFIEDANSKSFSDKNKPKTHLDYANKPKSHPAREKFKRNKKKSNSKKN